MTPPLPLEGGPKSHRRIIVSSRDRDRSAFPNPNQYEIKLDDDVDNVVSMRLISSSLPFPRYLIHRHNRKFDVVVQGEDGPQLFGVNIDIGDYGTATDIATALQEALVAAGFASATVSPQERTGVLVVRIDPVDPVNFTFVFGPSSPAAVLGFPVPTPNSNSAVDREVSVASINGVLTAPYRCNLEPEKTVVLKLTCPSADDILSAFAGAATGAFAVISHSSQPWISTDFKIERRWKAPIPRLFKIGVRFTDLDGNLYDFQNQDHVLEFAVASGGNAKYRPDQQF